MDPTFAAFLALLNSIPVLGPYIVYVPLVCGVAAIVDAALPPPPAGSLWVWPRRVVHVLALNIANARNAVPAGYTPAPLQQKAQEVIDAANVALKKSGELAVAQTGQAEAAVPVKG